MAGDGGVDDADPLCTEQYANSQVASLKVVSDAGYGFTGWIINGAHIPLASAEPLFLSTMPLLAGDVPFTQCTQNTEAQVSCPRIGIDTDSNNDGMIDELDDPIEETSGKMIDYQNTAAREPVQLLAEALDSLDDTYSLEIAAISGGSHLQVWDSATAAKPFTLPKHYTLDDALPPTLYVSGCKTSNCGPGDAMLEWRLVQQDGVTSTALSDKVLFTVMDMAHIGGEFRIIGYENQAEYEMKLTEEPDGTGTFFRTLGGMRLHLSALVLPDIEVEEYRWSADQGKFFGGYEMTAVELTGDALKGADLTDVYWEGEYTPDLNVIATLNLKIQGDPDPHVVTRSITNRVQKLIPRPRMAGDDVQMLQALINFFSWSYLKKLDTDGILGPGTNDRIQRILKQNYGSYWNQHTSDIAKCLNQHFDDYRQALNDFGWDNGNNPTQQNATMNDSHADFKKDSQTDSDGWVENAAALLTGLTSNIVTPNPDWSSDKRTLLLAVMEQESKRVHWNNWEVTISNVGAIGFLQVMSFNSKRYNDHPGITPIIDNSLNLYKPGENLKAAAQLLNNYLTKAFSGSWTKSGDDQDDLLAKALACYNGGRINILSSNSWENICTSGMIPQESLNFAVQIKDRLGLTIESFENQYK